MKALEAGEGSRTYRVRAPDAVHEWLSGMSAEERGQMLAEVYTRNVRPAEYVQAEPPKGSSSRRGRDAKPRASLEEVTARFARPAAPAQVEHAGGLQLPVSALGEAAGPVSAATHPEAPSRPAGEELRLSGTVPAGLSAYALAVVEDLRRGGVLVEDGQVYRLTVDGRTRTVRGDTVYGLRRARALASLDDTD